MAKAPRATKTQTSGKGKTAKKSAPTPKWAGWLQWLLFEFCIIAAFATVAFAVFQSLEQKRQSYLITKLIDQKTDLETALDYERNRVERLSSLDRIGDLVETHELQLAPATRPALRLDPTQENQP